MATKLFPASHMFPPKPKKMIKTNAAAVLVPTHNNNNNITITRFRFSSSAKAATTDVQNNEEDESTDNTTLSQIKQQLFDALQGIINSGIFGVPSAKKSEIEKLVELLESQNPTPCPTLSLQKVGGAWKLIYSTITLLGSKRTKLGLRDFITLEDIFQSIDVAQGKAVNVIKFSSRGLNLFNGQLTIEASFKVASETRVDIRYDKSVITPDQLMNIFRKNYDLLLGIFNPEGWLEITYVDDSLRIGRDDKGNIFILERQEDGC